MGFKVNNYNINFEYGKNNTIQKNKQPPIGMGYIYKITVLRAGLPDLVYIGQTAQTMQQRFDQHYNSGLKLGELGLNAKKRGVGFKTQNLLHISMRTQLGFIRTRPKSAVEKYTKIEPIGLYSLMALNSAEIYFIGGKIDVSSPNPARYDTKRWSNFANRDLGGEYQRKDINTMIISAYYFLKHEVMPKPLYNTDKDIAKEISTLVYKKTATDKQIEKIVNVLKDFLHYRDIYQFVILNKGFNTTQVIATISRIMAQNIRNQKSPRVKLSERVNLSNFGLIEDFYDSAAKVGQYFTTIEPAIATLQENLAQAVAIEARDMIIKAWELKK